MIVNGKQIAKEVVDALAHARVELPPVVRLGVLMGAQDAAAASFVKIKERLADKLQVVVVKEFLEEGATTAQALRSLERLSKNCQGIIVQLPLPVSVDADDILKAIPPQKDIDFVNPPVAGAIAEIFRRNGVSVQNKQAVVVGQGKLVGAPASELLRGLGAEVVVVTEHKGSLTSLKEADIVVLGAGQPGLISPQMLKEGVVLIDAGTSEAGGKLAGDADPACAEVASLFTPVPGGIGPIAVAMIFKNLFTLARKG